MKSILAKLWSRCKENIENEDEDDWDDLLDDLEAFTGGEMAEEEDNEIKENEENERSTEMKLEISNQVENAQHYFEKLFKYVLM